MSIDEAWGDKTAFGVKLPIHWLRIRFAHVLDSIPFEYHDAVFDHFVFLAVKADDVTALNQGSHCFHLSNFGLEQGRTNKRS